MRKQTLAALLAVIASCIGTGCALTVDRVAIDYAPLANVTVDPRTKDVPVDVTTTDGRAEKRIGAKKNGYGVEMANIESTNDIAQTVESAIESELANRGFTIGDRGAQVKVEVVRFYNDFKLGFWSGTAVADVELSVKVLAQDGHPTYATVVAGEGTNKPIQLASGANAKIALERALHDAVSKLFADEAFVDAIVAVGDVGVEQVEG